MATPVHNIIIIYAKLILIACYSFIILGKSTKINVRVTVGIRFKQIPGACGRNGEGRTKLSHITVQYFYK